MAVNYPCVATNGRSLERLDMRTASYGEVGNLISARRDVGWSSADVFFDPVDVLPMDPFGMNVVSWIGNLSDYCMHCFGPDDMLPLDPFGMSLETVIMSLVEDFKATYGYCRNGNANQVERTSSCSGVIHQSTSDNLVEMESTLSAAIAGWLEDFQAMSVADYMTFDHWLDDTLFEDHVETDCVLPPDPFEMELDYALTAKTDLVGDVNGYLLNVSDNAQLDTGSIFSDCDDEDAGIELMEDIKTFFYYSDSEETCSNGVDGDGFSHEGLFFALGYLGVQDLLSMEMVSKSLRTAVADDPLLWKCIQINSSLSEKITDNALLRLTQRAQGSLHCLTLVCCTKITDEGIKRVLEDNPKLIKLCVPECVKLTIAGMIHNLRAFKVHAIPGINHLELGRLFSVSEEQYEELNSLLGIDKCQQQMAKPRFYHIARLFLECDDDRPLDIEMCLICNKYRIVYDCTLESCKKKGPWACRACDHCITRCAQCGRCIRDGMYVETFCFEYLCSRCWRNPTIW